MVRMIVACEPGAQHLSIPPHSRPYIFQALRYAERLQDEVREHAAEQRVRSRRALRVGGCALTGFKSSNAWRGMMVTNIVTCEPHAPVSMLQPLDQHLQTRFVVEQDSAIKPRQIILGAITLGAASEVSVRRDVRLCALRVLPGCGVALNLRKP
jgi:hypothetical protein